MWFAGRNSNRKCWFKVYCLTGVNECLTSSRVPQNKIHWNRVAADKNLFRRMTTCVSKIRVNETILQTQNNSWVTSGEELCYAKNSVKIRSLLRQFEYRLYFLTHDRAWIKFYESVKLLIAFMALFYCWSIKSNPHFILRRSNAMEKLDFTITLVRNNRKRRKKLRMKQKSNVILLSTTRIIYVIDNTTPVLCYSNLKFVYTKDFFSNHQINLTRIKKKSIGNRTESNRSFRHPKLWNKCH